jgi:hypothetical protein
MVLDQEIASIIMYLLNATGNPHPYYRKMPQDFLVPSAYFPPPEIDSQGYTMSTYALNFMWFIKFFHSDDQSAHELGFMALNALQEHGNAIPRIDEEGKPTGIKFRIKDPLLKPLDNASQLTLFWDSPRPYFRKEHTRTGEPEVSFHIKSAYDGALSLLNQDEEA